MDGVTLLGPELPCGAYALWIDVRALIAVRFGRFAGGRPVELACGPYLYVGSAMGMQGASTLARRLLRHATRSDGTAHPVQPALRAALGLAPPATKRLRWHIDYLLDCPAAALAGVVAVRAAAPQEAALAAALLRQAWTMPVAPGLGASDHPGASHLLRVTGSLDVCGPALLDVVRGL